MLFSWKAYFCNEWGGFSSSQSIYGGQIGWHARCCCFLCNPPSGAAPCLPPSGRVRRGSVHGGGRGGRVAGHTAASEHTKSCLLIGISIGNSLPSSEAVWFLSVARQQLWGTWRFHRVGWSCLWVGVYCMRVCGRARLNMTLRQSAQVKQI